MLKQDRKKIVEVKLRACEPNKNKASAKLKLPKNVT